MHALLDNTHQTGGQCTHQQYTPAKQNIHAALCRDHLMERIYDMRKPKTNLQAGFFCVAGIWRGGQALVGRLVEVQLQASARRCAPSCCAAPSSATLDPGHVPLVSSVCRSSRVCCSGTATWPRSSSSTRPTSMQRCGQPGRWFDGVHMLRKCGVAASHPQTNVAARCLPVFCSLQVRGAYVD